MPVAVGYERSINGQTDAAGNKWDAFGFGVFAVQLILLVGGMYGLGVGLWRLGLKISKGRVND